MLFVFKYKSLPIGLNIAGFQDLIPDFATLSLTPFSLLLTSPYFFGSGAVPAVPRFGRFGMNGLFAASDGWASVIGVW